MKKMYLGLVMFDIVLIVGWCIGALSATADTAGVHWSWELTHRFTLFILGLAISGVVIFLVSFFKKKP